MQASFILTSATDLASLQEHATALQADDLLLVPLWGLPWTDELRGAALRLAPRVTIRTGHGDLSYGRSPAHPWGLHPLPHKEGVIAEVLPFWRLRDPNRPFSIVIGNEPLLDPLSGHAQLPEEFFWGYRAHLAEAIAACREVFPGAEIVSPAHIQNHAIPIGLHADGQAWTTRIWADTFRRCDALGLHAYSAEQLTRGTKQLRDLVSADKPIILTEFALNERLSDAARGRRYAEVLRGADVAGVHFYHLDQVGGSDPAHFRDEYRLNPTQLAAFRAAWNAPAVPVQPTPTPPMALPDIVHYPHIQVEGFALSVIQFRTVDAFRRHLVQHDYRTTAPWGKGVVIHHTYRPTGTQWRGAASMRRLAEFYRFEVDNGAGKPKGGWTSGPHLFIVGDAVNPLDNGIWQLTPLNLEGTHGRAANGHTWGLEHVGDFTRQPMPAATAAFGQGAAAALLDWASQPTNEHTVSPHSRWGKPACPGRGVDMEAYRRGVAALRRAEVQ